MLQKILLLFLKVFRHLGNRQQVIFQMCGLLGVTAPKLSIYFRSRGEILFLFLLDLFSLISGVLGTRVLCVRESGVGPCGALIILWGLIFTVLPFGDTILEIEEMARHLYSTICVCTPTGGKTTCRHLDDVAQLLQSCGLCFVPSYCNGLCSSF